MAWLPILRRIGILYAYPVLESCAAAYVRVSYLRARQLLRGLDKGQQGPGAFAFSHSGILAVESKVFFDTLTECQEDAKDYGYQIPQL